MTEYWFPRAQCWFAVTRNAETGLFGGAFWPDGDDAQRCEIEPFAADAETATAYIKRQAAKAYDAQHPPRRDPVLAVAPWGDTYTASDIENGYMPSEARYVELEEQE